MNKRKKAILIGMILGDCYLQKTGQKNARVRLEHSEKQKDYLMWKGMQFPEYFQGKPQRLTRFNPVFKKQYSYWRWQSNASPIIGNYRHRFYPSDKKIIPRDLPVLLTDPLSLAVWFMDDGYYYRRDKMAYIYLPKYSQDEAKLLVETLAGNFMLKVKIKVKKRGNMVMVMGVVETKKFLDIITPYIIPSMNYKISSLDPLSTAA